MNAIARGFGVLALGLLAGGVNAQDADSADGAKEVGRLQDVQGTVLLKKGDQSIPVVEGQPLMADDEVLVTEGARALVVFNDGCDLALDEEEVYSVSRRSPCATLWWAAPAAAGVACGAAHATKSNNSRTLAAVGSAGVTPLNKKAASTATSA